MTTSFWIQYTVPGEQDKSSVPVAFNSYIDGQPKAWHFCDGPYDIFDLYYVPCEIDEDYVSPLQEAWEKAVLEIVAPKLARMGEGDAVSLKINGDSWFFEKAYLDRNGNET